jgi:hypothetical protein
MNNGVELYDDGDIIHHLDELIAAGWGSVPRNKIPENWRVCRPPSRTTRFTDITTGIREHYDRKRERERLRGSRRRMRATKLKSD